MFLQSLASATPAHVLTQKDCFALIRNSSWFGECSPAARQLLEKVMCGASGIQQRHYATDDLHRLFSLDAQELNESYEVQAPKLASQALQKALEQGGMKADELEAVFICTGTGYLCPRDAN